MKQYLLRLIPPGALTAYRDFRATQRSKTRARAKDAARTYSKVELAELLADVGVREGGVLMVHSALGRFNNTEGGAAGVLEVIRGVLGPLGTLAVPTFPFWVQAMQSGVPFDVRHSPSNMGVLTELVRNHPAAMRSMHPTHSVAAIGPLAEYLTKDQHKSSFAFGPMSPFYRAAQAGGKALLLGVDLNSFTGFHVYEDLIGPVSWLPVYEQELRIFPMIDWEGQNFNYSGNVHDLDYAANRDVQIATEGRASISVVKWIKTDYSKVALVDMTDITHFYLTELLEGRSAYGPVTIPEDERSRIASLRMSARSRLFSDQ